ncbi:type II secretion system protein [Pedobacter aquatilis]|uniref:type II secretion system protein n=1 Tax=Pedobacter aquatilis TaxID=351343 RepID=UPI0025B43CCF|nr:type II secretion system protein [Pedobacter aquatilis]MDN3588087.1 type II secretion system protein [Pedobacter aquatilis]
MAGLKNKKLEGSTLIEVLVAMVIIMVICSIAMVVFNNVLSGGVSFKKVTAQNQINVWMKSIEDSGEFEEETVWLDSVEYRMSIKPSDFPLINVLEIKAYQRGKPIAALKKYVQLKTEN